MINKRLKKYLKISILILIVGLLIPVSMYVYAYSLSPDVIRNPKQEHYHFRMQILVNGKAEDFGTKKYQTGYKKDLCNANLAEQPIHFHDNKDQFTHIHWEGMTGGMVMKYYGWNYIGGIDNALGYKMDDLGDIQKVTTHGNYLPDVPGNTKFYIYTGDEKSYKKRSFDEWKNTDLEKFFGKTSNYPAHKLNNVKASSLPDFLVSNAYAHGDEDHSTPTDNETDDEKLTRINNLLGNVVIFVQESEPSDKEIKDRFDNLEPLSDSTCGG